MSKNSLADILRALEAAPTRTPKSELNSLVEVLMGARRPTAKKATNVANPFENALRGFASSRSIPQDTTNSFLSALHRGNTLSGPATPRINPLLAGLLGVGLSATLLTGDTPARRATLLTAADTVRRVYFSFHYQRDIQRVNVVKNHWVSKGTQRAAGFFNSSLEEEAKTKGNLALKRLINSGMENSSLTCVLIGAETWSRRWVRYEIFRSVAQGKGVFGVRINNIRNLQKKRDSFGPNPFANMGYVTRKGSNKLHPMVHNGRQWSDFGPADSFFPTAAKYLEGFSRPRLDAIFPVYDWIEDDGFNNFSTWATSAARKAGR